jgi:hypothetical protein
MRPERVETFESESSSPESAIHVRGVAASARPACCSPNLQHLPAAPLVEAVSSYASKRQLSLERLFDQAGRRALQRGRQSGELTLVAVERFCDRLGLHPRELYGDAYDRAAFAYIIRRPEPAHVRERSRSGGER